MKAAGVEYLTLGGVVPNPRLSKVREGIALAREAGVDFILAVGGGSVIDSAKAIGYGIPYSGDVWDFYSGKAVPETVCPVGAVLTLSAAGSEMSNSSVITDEENELKWGYNDDICRCPLCGDGPATHPYASALSDRLRRGGYPTHTMSVTSPGSGRSPLPMSWPRNACAPSSPVGGPL